MAEQDDKYPLTNEEILSNKEFVRSLYASWYAGIEEQTIKNINELQVRVDVIEAEHDDDNSIVCTGCGNKFYNDNPQNDMKCPLCELRERLSALESAFETHILEDGTKHLNLEVVLRKLLEYKIEWQKVMVRKVHFDGYGVGFEYALAMSKIERLLSQLGAGKFPSGTSATPPSVGCMKYIKGKGCPLCKFKCIHCKHGVAPVYDEENDETYEGYCEIKLDGCRNCGSFDPKAPLGADLNQKKYCKDCKHSELRDNPYPHIKQDLYCHKREFGVDPEYINYMSCDDFKPKAQGSKLEPCYDCRHFTGNEDDPCSEYEDMEISSKPCPHFKPKAQGSEKAAPADSEDKDFDYEGLMWCPQFHDYCLHTQQIESAIKQKIAQQLRDEVKDMISYINECSRNDDFSWSLFRLDIENNWSNFIRDKLEGGKDE